MTQSYPYPPATIRRPLLRSRFPCQQTPARCYASRLCVDFYYEFSRQLAGLLIYFFPSEITNAEHMPSGHLIEPMAA